MCHHILQGAADDIIVDNADDAELFGTAESADEDVEARAEERDDGAGPSEPPAKRNNAGVGKVSTMFMFVVWCPT